ncbi:LPS-assembly protein LptD [Botrimarina colliarenosi]|uniref:LPS-assembly protein LptD n=1 Tax=Botrimarina colliarenosi TaxID=2528001 RepID=A0A5C6AB37_9BACT|nr:hypothetical protein [Botrimarina colliarenosi]TWT96789.1 LPS-assembly protein LptD [Botrimarina colliarenosi]
MRPLGVLVLWLLVRLAPGQVELQRPDLADPITVTASEAAKWTQGAYQMWRLKGGVSFTQGKNSWRAAEAIVWVDEPTSFDEPTKLLVYLEAGGGEPVWLDLYDKTPDETATPIARQQSPDWFGRLRSVGGVEWRTPTPTAEPVEKPAIYARAQTRFSAEWDPLAGEVPANRQPIRDEGVEPVQYLGDPFMTTAPAPQRSDAGQPSVRSIQLFPRYGAGLQADLLTSPAGESVGVLSGGATLVISGVDVPGMPLAAGSVDRVDLSADRVVVWTSGVSGLSGGRLDQSGDTPIEIYLEGNIEFRQGERTIYANRMFYDARRKTGILLDAELLTPLPDVEGYQYRGLVRLKAQAIRQLEDSRYVAEDALFTTSRLEVPTYSLKSDRITFDDFARPVIDPVTGQQAANPFTGEPITNREQNARAEGNRVEFGGVPLIRWPTLETDLQEPRYYIDDFRIRNDSVFGFQVLTDLDIYQLLGSKAPAGTDWTVGIDYLSDRGLGLGTNYRYDTDHFFGAEGPATGRVDIWGIRDDGKDNLGFGRRDIVPEESFRGRAFWDHRQRVRGGVFNDWVVQGQIGWISDRTFLEQYYEQEWDEGADQLTGLRLRRTIDNQSLTIEANGQLNEFFTETQWLPRLDHWLMGQELGGQNLTWFAHSQAAYANVNVATTPTNPTLAAQFFQFPWEASVEGERLVTRQEIDLPIDLEDYGLPAKVVPYFMGEVAHWGDSLAGGDLQRTYLQTGVRASAPFWAINPNVRDPLFNLDGLAHKVVFDGEVSYADASRDLNEFALFDEIEDNSLEEIRRRTFFPTIPATQDPRFYLVRSGMQGWVAAPTVEVVDDLSVARLGMRHRLQTKRGAPGQQRVVDWLTFDTNASLFPDTDQNFGETVGLVDYDLAWHLGDRFTFLSDGFVDLFNDGLQTWSTGVALNRPARGNAYIGYRSIRGPFNSDLLSLRLNYRLGPKWVGSAATVIDFGEAGNIGQTFALSRIGESLLFTMGLNVDESKNNVGFSFLVEPRFLPRTSLTRRTGIDIPPAGAYGLE